MNRSISDDDLCSDCQHCGYNPGDESSCEKDWPTETEATGPRAGYIVMCMD